MTVATRGSMTLAIDKCGDVVDALAQHDEGRRLS